MMDECRADPLLTVGKPHGREQYSGAEQDKAYVIAGKVCKPVLIGIGVYFSYAHVEFRIKASCVYCLPSAFWHDGEAI